MRFMWLGVLLLVACSATPTRYHTLSADVAGVNANQVVSQAVPSLGVGPVKLPTLLDRESLVLRKDATTVDISDTELWGGQLEDEFLRALQRQLQAGLPQTRLQTVPWELSQTPRYQITLQIDRFDGVLGQQAVLQGQWQLQQAQTGKVLATQPMSFQQAVEDGSVDAVVRAQSQLLAQLATQIIQGLARYAQ